MDPELNYIWPEFSLIRLPDDWLWLLFFSGIGGWGLMALGDETYALSTLFTLEIFGLMLFLGWKWLSFNWFMADGLSEWT